MGVVDPDRLRPAAGADHLHPERSEMLAHEPEPPGGVGAGGDTRHGRDRPPGLDHGRVGEIQGPSAHDRTR